jgi:hypothetical protein
MCLGGHDWEWHGHFAGSVPFGVSRRSALKAGLIGVGGIAVSGLFPDLARASHTAPTTPNAPGFDGVSSFRTAQHIHARGSEGPASMTAQAAEAARWVDAMWFTDHDWREGGVGAPKVVHFNSLTAERLGVNPAWQWRRHDAGVLDAGSGGGIQTSPVSPGDPDPHGSLFARAVTSTGNRASVAWHADDTSSRNSMRTPAYGQVWRLDVLLQQADASSWGFLRVGLSYHPTTGGRPDAYYFLEYRFGPFASRSYSLERLDPSSVDTSDGGGDAGPIVLRPGEEALLGVVWVPQQRGSWVTQTMSFTDDIAALFPGMVARDNSIRGVWLGATSARRTAHASFDYLRMDRVYGQAQLDDRVAIASELAARVPGVRLYNGTELSYGGAHRQWLGGEVQLPVYPTDKAKGGASPSTDALVAMILDGGGMPVANHPFGTDSKRMTDAQAATEARAYVVDLLDSPADARVQGVEVFYRQRGGASLEHHLRLFRLAVANGLVVTATGASDNHWGRTDSWIEEQNHFITSIWADDVGEESLVDAQRRGRAYCSELGTFDGQLDLSLEGDLMGQVGVHPGTVTRQLTVMATQLPKGSSVEVWKVPIGGGLDAEPGGVVERIPQTAFTGTTAMATVDTAEDCAFSVTVVNRKGKLVAGSNPVWSLQDEPATWSIPEDRRAG